MQIEEPLGPVDPPVDHSARKVGGRLVELEREFLDPFAEQIPGSEAVFARNHGLGVVQGEFELTEFGVGCGGEGGQNAKPLPADLPNGRLRSVGGVEQVLRLLFELLEIWALG